ncbi:hypothetical protein BGW80DRAFT_1464815 [Lactifluus volemus]|nr:hypothetical protein BGW80DRAFT_1468055 [Lactifluus volemus]KAH9959284.1 hypothetical protein BGW80DRAFT_1464815 [Lactifluus volemus]
MSNGDVVMDGDVDLWDALGTDAPTSASTMAPRPPPTDEDEDMYVLLVADRAGATFTLGLLDDLVRRIVHHQYARSEHTLRIEFAWIIHSTSMQWFAPMLLDIAEMAAGSSLDLHIAIFVTCLCQPEAVLPIPILIVMTTRPHDHHFVCMLSPHLGSE